jgi:hypothetical protein
VPIGAARRPFDPAFDALLMISRKADDQPVTYEPGKPWTARVKSLVLYNEDEVWRFAIANEAGIVDGRLPDLSSGAPVEDAQKELMRLVRESTGLDYEATWSSTKPHWWSAEVEHR